jgi:superfamily I DNA and RNA helicase
LASASLAVYTEACRRLRNERNLLYTGVTRGKRLVVLVGQKKAIAIAVRNASGRRRWSKLVEAALISRFRAAHRDAG